MAGNGRNGWNDCKWLEMAGNDWKWLEMARNKQNGWIGLKWINMAGMAGNGFKLLEGWKRLEYV